MRRTNATPIDYLGCVMDKYQMLFKCFSNFEWAAAVSGRSSHRCPSLPAQWPRLAPSYLSPSMRSLPFSLTLSVSLTNARAHTHTVSLSLFLRDSPTRTHTFYITLHYYPSSPPITYNEPPSPFPTSSRTCPPRNAGSRPGDQQQGRRGVGYSGNAQEHHTALC